MSCIALLSDFGYDNWYVGEIKAIIENFSPSTRIIDINHSIAPGDIRTAAFNLWACSKNFPSKTVFCVLVDPGVREHRSAILVQTANQLFVGPDNGILSWTLLSETQEYTVYHIKNSDLFLQSSQNSPFRGRDQFAPVASHLAKGLAPEMVGPRTNEWLINPWPEPSVTTTQLRGEVMHVDKFGNIFTNFPNGLIPKADVTIEIGPIKKTIAIHSSYDEITRGELFCYCGSTGLIEIGLENGNAAADLNISLGQEIFFYL